MPPQAVTDVVDPLIAEYARVWSEVQGQLLVLESDPERWRARRRLREMSAAIESEMDRLAGITTQWAQEQMPFIHQLGYSVGAVEAGAASFTQIDTAAARAIADGLTDDLLAATKNVSSTTRELVRAIARDRAFSATVRGQTASGAADEMRRLLNDHRVYAVRYADGSLHGLAEYSQMAIRTVTGTAYNDAMLFGVQSEGVRYVEVLDGPGCGWTFHSDTETALGKVVSVEEAREWPLAHPNCRRTFGARPDLSAPGRTDSVTEQQTRDQIAADVARRMQQEASRVRRRARTRPDRRGYRSGRDAA